MATEFQRANLALEKLQESLCRLAGTDGEADDWVVLATTSAAEGAISEEERQTFLDAEEKLRELDALTTKMRKKCQAHEELQRLQAKLPQKGCCEVLLRRVAELQGTATYGCNMLQKVSNLLERFDAARERFTAEVVPRFAPPVAAAEAEEVLREEWAQQQAELDRSKAWAKQQQPLVELLAESEKRLQDLHLAQEDASEWLRVTEISLCDLGFEELEKRAPNRSIYS